ncbi:MAG: hypothetical protein J7K39_10345 [Bacteroidales bacterium]|nr:hypothetical protein [Bacteroidales bacterium]
MAVRKKRKKEDIFVDEASCLNRVRNFLSEENKSPEETVAELDNLTNNYSELLDQIKLITRISDRLQRKLDQTNDKLNEVNLEIQEKNVQLEQTINDLAEAKIGRRATTFVFIFALALFLVSEAFIEPWIERYYNNFFISLGIKGVIALSIKPIEGLVEKTLVKKARQRTLKAARAKRQIA